ncbi:MAG: fasciclin domain-containing protein [Anaerolineae bacterium]
MMNLLATITSGSFKALVTSLSRARLGYVLAEPGPFTLLAPTDSAFFRATEFTDWQIANDIPTLKAMLACHIIPGIWPAALLVRQRSLRSFCGETIEINFEKVIQVGGARIIRPDLFASNGIIHIVDDIVLPRAAQIAENPAWSREARTLSREAF